MQTIYDGDIVFTLASGQIEVDCHTVGLMAEGTLINAIIRGVTKAKKVKGIPSFAQVATKTRLLPSSGMRRHKELKIYNRNWCLGLRLVEPTPWRVS